MGQFAGSDVLNFKVSFLQSTRELCWVNQLCPSTMG